MTRLVKQSKEKTMKRVKASRINKVPKWPDAAPCHRKFCNYCGNGYPKRPISKKRKR